MLANQAGGIHTHRYGHRFLSFVYLVVSKDQRWPSPIYSSRPKVGDSYTTPVDAAAGPGREARLCGLALACRVLIVRVMKAGLVTGRLAPGVGSGGQPGYAVQAEAS